MYKRDLITVEIQKLAEVLSRILKFNLDGDIDEAHTLFDQTLLSGFGITPEMLFDEPQEFSRVVNEKVYSAEKLDMLSQFLYIRLQDNDEPNYKKSTAAKLLFLYRVLEKQHRIISLENLNRQSFLLQYL